MVLPTSYEVLSTTYDILPTAKERIPSTSARPDQGLLVLTFAILLRCSAQLFLRKQLLPPTESRPQSVRVFETLNSLRRCQASRSRLRQMLYRSKQFILSSIRLAPRPPDSCRWQHWCRTWDYGWYSNHFDHPQVRRYSTWWEFCLLERGSRLQPLARPARHGFPNERHAWFVTYQCSWRWFNHQLLDDCSLVEPWRQE